MLNLHGRILEIVSDNSVSRHVNADTIICVNDPYDYENSTKDVERHRRAKGYGQIPNKFFKPDGDLAKLLAKSENKTRLHNFSLKCMQGKLATHNKNIFFSVGRSCINLRAGVQEPHL